VPGLVSGLVASDNCTSADLLTKSQSPAAGTLVGIGQTSVVISVKDAVGNEATCTVKLTVQYNWNGFFQPVDNPGSDAANPVFNRVKAEAPSPSSSA